MPQNTAHSLYNIDPLKPLIADGYVLLTPNFRIARRIKTVWDSVQAAAGERVWSPLQVLPLESWLGQRWEKAVELGLLQPKVPVTEGQAHELWQKIIAQHQHSSDNYTLLRPEAAAVLAGQAREGLSRWQVDLDNAHIQQEFMLDKDCSTYLAWHTLFQAALEQRGLVTSGDRFNQLLAVADAMPQYPVALLDFDDIPPLHRSCVDACSSELKLLDYTAEEGRCSAFAFPDKRSELTAAARWAKQQSETESGATIAIILPEMARDRGSLEYLLRREFDCQGESCDALPVNFSAGVSLDRVPPVRAAFQLLSLALQRTTVDDVLAVLQSRFVPLADSGSALAIRFIGELFNDGREELDIGELRHRASQVKLGEQKGLCLGEHLLDVSQLRAIRKHHAPSDWVSHLIEVLDLWGWPGRTPLDSVEYQQVEMWYQLLEEFSSYDAFTGAIPLAEALGLLRRCAARHVFQPQTVDSRIQVLGMLEGAGLEFDHLWICGLQANVWPAPARPSPLIPLSLQRKLSMPHASAEREWDFAKALMSRYKSSSSDVNASYVQMLDGVSELPSALLEEFEWHDGGQDSSTVDPQWARQRAATAMETLEDSKGPALEPSEAARLGGGSSLLEDQSHCPFRSFAKHRLRVKPLGDFQIGLSPAARGSILHDALYTLWGDLGDSARLRSMNEVDLRHSITEASEAALRGIPTRQRIALGQGYLQLEGERLQQLLQEWLKLELQRDAFSVHAREQDITLRMEPLQIKLRVDRIDQLEDGSQFIIDYKSGRCEVKDWLGERPAKPQLLLYGIASSAAAQDVAALAFAQVRPRDCAYVGAGRIEAAPGIRADIEKLAGDKLGASDWDELNMQWRNILEGLVADFAAGNALVDPVSSSSCSYCGLQPLCRIGEDIGGPA